MSRTGLQFLDTLELAIVECRVTSNNRSQPPLSLPLGIERVTAWLKETRLNRQKVILIGNGGSAAIASHQAVDLMRNGGVNAITFNDASLITCLSNDFGYEVMFTKAISLAAETDDLLIAISSSGKSENILNGVYEARKRKCRVVTFSGFQPQNPLRRLGDINFYVPSSKYGTVESAHLILIHSIVDQFASAHWEGAHATRRPDKALPKHAENPAG